MTETGVISGVSVSHPHADVEEIESAQRDSTVGVIADLLGRDGVSEAFAIQTCNRAEAYVVTADAADGREALAGFAPEVRDGVVTTLDHEASLRHLMRVAAGLESLVLGEDQILGQLKRALSEAQAAGGVGDVLGDAVAKAIHVGERARTETRINEGSVSLGSAAVDLARRETDLDGAAAAVVGAGEMGTLAARALADTEVSRVVVANRTVPRAEHVAADLAADAAATGLDALPSVVADADVLISATGAAGHVIGADELADAGDTVCIDLGQPRDVDPAAESVADGVDLFDIDALEAVTAETEQQRREAAETVESMIDDEFDRLLESFKRKRADEAISAMYEAAEATKRRELDEALAKLEAQGGLSDEQRDTVEGLADALVGQLLAAPTRSLREAAAEDDWTTIHTAMRLFDPEFDAAPNVAEGESGAPSRHVLEEASDD
ncbi:glutamyl-tRNA reductase [Halobaculum sp. D14]|uniref:glutamyl-tRNA reductase n=1 Tax=unclassified Halobaculum TaxID=2640896 RepID=UPI003EBDFFC2